MSLFAGRVVLVVPPRDFPARALLTLVERLREHAIELVVASAQVGPCRSGAVQVTATHDLGAAALLDGTGAVIVLDEPGGQVARDDQARELLRRARAAGAIVGAIGAGVFALLAAGLALGHEVAAPRQLAEAIARAGGAPVLGVDVITDEDGFYTATEDGAGALADDLAQVASVRAPDPLPV